MQRNTVHDRSHTELAHAVVDVTPRSLLTSHNGPFAIDAQIRRGFGVGQV